MDRLLEILRRNPDAIAIAVLSLVLGLGRQAPAPWGGAAVRALSPVGIHDILIEAEDAADSIHIDVCLPGWLAR
ncbi:MAG TPA: hypothetical protein VHA11_10450 [Bryobacteraceae bacterium]|nr:hypothetical protein [Bryobacteraceae bacterium]